MDRVDDDDSYASIADFCEHVVPYRDRADVDPFVDAINDSAGPVLEAGCCTGRVLIPTARSGVAITGLDLSAAMLDVCGTKLGAEPGAVHARANLIRADMCVFDLERTFRLITMPFRSFQPLLTVEYRRACLTTLRGHPEPNGGVILFRFEVELFWLAAGIRSSTCTPTPTGDPSAPSTPGTDLRREKELT